MAPKGGRAVASMIFAVPERDPPGQALRRAVSAPGSSAVLAMLALTDVLPSDASCAIVPAVPPLFDRGTRPLAPPCRRRHLRVDGPGALADDPR